MAVVEPKEVPGVEIRGEWGPRYEEILSEQALPSSPGCIASSSRRGCGC